MSLSNTGFSSLSIDFFFESANCKLKNAIVHKGDDLLGTAVYSSDLGIKLVYQYLVKAYQFTNT